VELGTDITTVIIALFKELAAGDPPELTVLYPLTDTPEIEICCPTENG
jgi:hypothetical protein